MAYIRGLLRDPEASEDIFQEVWIALNKAIGEGKPIPNCPAWCRVTAKNLIHYHWQRQKYNRVVFDSELLELLDQAFGDAEDEEVKAIELTRENALKHCLESLPGHARELMRLRYESRLSMAELAKVFQKKSGAVTGMVFRVRKVLERCIEQKLESQTL